jgi:hypothetical protein
MGASGQRHAPAALPPGKDPRYPLDRRLGGLRAVWTQRPEKKSFASARDRISVVQLFLFLLVQLDCAPLFCIVVHSYEFR